MFNYVFKFRVICQVVYYTLHNKCVS